MDIDGISAIVAESEKPAKRTINKPNGEPYRGADGTESTVGALGSESKAYKEARDKITRRALRRRQQQLTPEDLKQNRIDLAAAAMTEEFWAGWESGKAPLPFSIENARKLIAAEHILIQVEELITEHADFFSAKSNGSPRV